MGCKNAMGFGMVEMQNQINFKENIKKEATI